ncbi:MAG: hypothetical protein QGH39_00795 [Candidatus Thermoplasmatota archaeon]|nr:hypothetical protein [Candidatus Thermoplasmatota archaeon]
MFYNIFKRRGEAINGAIVFLILFSIIFSGCTWFGGEEEERIPTAILKSEGKNRAGYFVVRVDVINYPIRARNVEIAFLDANGTKVAFSVGRNTTGVTLDHIYFSSYSGPDERNQVIYYDVDNDLRLAGTKANHTKDYFIIYPRLGLKNSGNSESTVANLTLILYWRDDSYLEKDEDVNSELIIGKTLIFSNNTVEMDVVDGQNNSNDSSTNITSILIIVFVLALLCITLIVTFLLIKSRKSNEDEIIETSNNNNKKDNNGEPDYDEVEN